MSRTPTKNSKARDKAASRHEKTYEGNYCKKHDTYTRYTSSGGCYACHCIAEANQLARERAIAAGKKEYHCPEMKCLKHHFSTLSVKTGGCIQCEDEKKEEGREQKKIMNENSSSRSNVEIPEPVWLCGFLV